MEYVIAQVFSLDQKRDDTSVNRKVISAYRYRVRN
jgi:hypothetical protein